MTEEQDRIAVEPAEPAPTAPVAGSPATRSTRSIPRVAALGGSLLLGAGIVFAAVAGTTPSSGVAGTGLFTLANSVAGAPADGSAGTWGPDGDHHGGRGMGGPGFGNGPAEEIAAAATALGMTQDELRAQLDAGKTIAQVATAEGVDLQKVIDAVTSVEQDEIAAALKAGTITQAQADEMTANLAQHVTDFVNRVCDGPRDGSAGPGFRMGGDWADDLAVAAKAIGISSTDLQAQLQAGKSVADVAKAAGVDAQAVIDALVADETAELADRVKAGTITQDQADRMAADLTQRITDLVNGTFSGRDGMGGPGGRHGHDGHQDHDGMGPGGFPGGSPDGTSGTSAPSA